MTTMATNNDDNHGNLRERVPGVVRLADVVQLTHCLAIDGVHPVAEALLHVPGVDTYKRCRLH